MQNLTSVKVVVVVSLSILVLAGRADGHENSDGQFRHVESAMPFPGNLVVTVSCEAYNGDPPLNDPDCGAHGAGIDFNYNGEHYGGGTSDDTGIPVVATANGIVRRVKHYGTVDNWGLCVEIEDVDGGGRGTGTIQFFCHLSTSAVREQQRVVQGQVVGHIGRTGDPGYSPHLHYQRQLSVLDVSEEQAIEIGFLDGCEYPDANMDPCDPHSTTPPYTPGNNGPHMSGNISIFASAAARLDWLLDGLALDKAEANPAYPLYYPYDGNLNLFDPARDGISRNVIVEYMYDAEDPYASAEWIYDAFNSGRQGYWVRHGFYGLWIQSGGLRGIRGLPIGDEYPTGFFDSGRHASSRQNFTHSYATWIKPSEDEPGALEWHDYPGGYGPGMIGPSSITIQDMTAEGILAGSSHQVSGWVGAVSYPVADVYHRFGASRLIGEPTGGVHHGHDGHIVQEFNGNDFGRTLIVWDESGSAPFDIYVRWNAHWLKGANLSYWETHSIGAPVTDEFVDPNTGYCRQDFSDSTCLVWIPDDADLIRASDCSDVVLQGTQEIGVLDGQLCSLDGVVTSDIDGDGVDDLNDNCPATPFRAFVTTSGCSVAQLVEPCSDRWSMNSHGDFIDAVEVVLNEMMDQGVISKSIQKCVHQAAVHSNVGKPKGSRGHVLTCEDLERDVLRGGVCDRVTNGNSNGKRGCNAGGSTPITTILLLSLLMLIRCRYRSA